MTAARPDLLVIGGGVFGLSIAHAGLRAGLTVTLAEAERIGAGASGGPVGALVPVSPLRWDAVKAFQLAGLTMLPGEAARLAEESGLDPGWRRTGRLAPLADEAARARAAAQAEAAARHWPREARFELLDRPPPGDWPGPAAAPAGVARETLSARVTPAAWLAARARALAGRTRLLEGWRLTALSPEGVARFPQGEIVAGHVVLATGWRAFDQARRLGGPEGGGVKGQAALLGAVAPEGAALIAGGGLFLVPQPGGVAVGSTREPDWRAPAPDAALDGLIRRARALSPRLAGAEVRARWAGIRPRAAGRLPVAGPLPGHPRIWLATGAQGIGFAIAHLVAEAVIAGITGTRPTHPLPPGSAPGFP